MKFFNLKVEYDGKQLCSSSIKILKVYQVWPNDASDKHHLFRAALLSLPTLATISLLFLFVIHSAQTGKFMVTDFIETIGLCLSSVGIIIALGNIINSQKEVAAMMENISDFHEFGRPSNSDLVERNSNLFVYVYQMCTIVGCIFYFVYGPQTRGKCLVENEEHDLDRVCGLSFPTWLPFEAAAGSFRYIACFVNQFVGTVYAVGAGGTVNTFLCTMVEAMLPRIQHMNKMLNTVFEITSDGVERRSRFVNCVRYHQSIIGLVREINSIFGRMYLIHMTFSTALVSILLLQFLLAPSIKVGIHVVAWVLVLFLMCNAGQRLMNQSDLITEAIYNTEWYTVDVDLQKDILFMLFRSQRILYLNPTGFGQISYVTFKDIMSRAYSFLTLLFQHI